MKSKCSKCQYPLEYTLLYNGLCEHCLLEKAIEAPDIKTYDELWRGIKKLHKRRCEYAGEHGCDFCGITWE